MAFGQLKKESSTYNISLHSIWQSEDLSDLFHLPLSEEAFGQYQELNTLLQELQLFEDPDIWQISSGESKFQVSKIYSVLIGENEVMPAIKWIWDTCCQLKYKIFFWLLLRNIMNTRAMLHRKHFFLPDYSAVMCGTSLLETRDHLFFTSPFAHVW